MRVPLKEGIGGERRPKDVHHPSTLVHWWVLVHPLSLYHPRMTFFLCPFSALTSVFLETLFSPRPLPSTVKTVRLNTRSQWIPPYVEHFMTHDDFGHINTPSHNEPHNFEHWTQIWEHSTEIVLVTLNTCVSHSVSTTVISQFILLSLYSSSCNAFKCCSKRRDLNHEWEKKVHRKNISREGQSIARFGQWDVCESLCSKVLCLRRYNYQLKK